MKKFIPYIIGALLAVFVMWLFMPQSCERKPSDIEVKANESYKIDSIERIHTDKVNSVYDSLVKIMQHDDSLHAIKINTLSVKYNALRSIVKNIKPVIDTSNQSVSIKANDYAFFVDQGIVSDSLYQEWSNRDFRKDSIIELKTKQNVALKSQSERTVVALEDQRELVGDLEKKLKKAKWWNKFWSKVAIVGVAANFVH